VVRDTRHLRASTLIELLGQRASESANWREVFDLSDFKLAALFLLLAISAALFFFLACIVFHLKKKAPSLL
jgi:hypothetical protein